MTGYTVAEVAKILDLPPQRVRAFVHQGLVEGTRGARGEFRFSFQDLVLLRTARGLRERKVPVRRVRQALEALRGQLPEGRPVSAVHVFAEGDEVVVHDGGAKWEPTSGQILFDFEVADLERKVEAIAPRRDETPPDPEEALDAEGWHTVGLELEPAAPDRARDAYRRALERDPLHPEARVNLARLLHDKGLLEAAARHYDLALGLDPTCTIAHFNRAVLLEDLNRHAEAIEAYRRAIELDSKYREALLNLARLYERIGEKQQALQTLAAFKRLLS